MNTVKKIHSDIRSSGPPSAEDIFQEIATILARGSLRALSDPFVKNRIAEKAAINGKIPACDSFNLSIHN